MHHAFVQRHPFGVCAGHAHELFAVVQRGVQVARSEQLRLLASHDIRRSQRVAAAHAGDDEHAVANAGGILRELVELRGARQIGHFDPADCRAHHAAQRRGQIAVRAAPVGGLCVEDFRVFAARFSGARPLAHVQRLAIGIAKHQPQIAGSPIACDERRTAHGMYMPPLTCTMLPVT